VMDVVRATPLFDDKLNIYQSTINVRILKFSPDGEIIWTWKSPYGSNPTVPAIMDGTLYGNSERGIVYAVDMATGKEKWAVNISNGTGGDTACIFAAYGAVVSATKVGTKKDNNNGVVALNTDGSHRWTYVLDRGFEVYNFQGASPGDGTLVSMDASGGLYKVSLDTGKLIWESGIPERENTWFTTGAGVIGPNGLVYCASNWGNHGLIHAYKLSTGEPVWRTNVTLRAMQGVAIGKLAGSEGLSVVFGVGENPGFPAYLVTLYFCFQAAPFLWWVGTALSFGCCVRRRQKQGKSKVVSVFCLLPMMFLNLLGCIALAYAAHRLSLATGGKPPGGVFWWMYPKPQQIWALDAETGAQRWVVDVHPLDTPACAGDEEELMPRMFGYWTELGQTHPICLPDSWAQAVVDADGTSFLGFADGRLFAVRDEDGDGKIASKEISEHDFGHAFQASQGLAPGTLAVAPCGGGLWVWKK